MPAQDHPALPLVASLVQHYEELVRYAGRVLEQRGAVPATDHAHQRRDLAREAVHEVCLQLLRDDRQPPQVQVPLAFLRTLSKRRAIDTLRSEALWQRLSSSIEDHPECLVEASGRQSDPASLLGSRQMLGLLVQAIESLPPRCQAVFILHKIHEWPQAQVAGHLGISLKTVEKHVRIGTACCRYALNQAQGPAASHMRISASQGPAR